LHELEILWVWMFFDKSPTLRNAQYLHWLPEWKFGQLVEGWKARQSSKATQIMQVVITLRKSKPKNTWLQKCPSSRIATKSRRIKICSTATYINTGICSLAKALTSPEHRHKQSHS
jgi:hypothetical protein